MPFLIAVVVFVGILSLLNALLVVGVIRRLREHTSMLDTLNQAVTGGPGVPADGGVSVGETVEDFVVTTTDGETVSRDDLAPSTVVAFLAADCSACHDQLPHLLTWARGHDRHHLVAVVDAHGGDPGDLVERLTPVARVVSDAGESSIARAFGVRSYPRFFVLGAGATVSDIAGRVSRLPAGAAA
jgi:hypothetical protein